MLGCKAQQQRINRWASRTQPNLPKESLIGSINIASP